MASLSMVEEDLLQLCREHPNGLPHKEMELGLPLYSVEDRANAINNLLQKRLLHLFQSAEGLVYKQVDVEEATKFKGLSSEDMLVYQIIQQAKNMGIWTKDLKMKSNLHQPQITKILKTLESRRLIKAVKSVASKNRKVYMLMELEPSREITGGAWYTEQEFDAEFIHVLTDQAHAFIRSRGPVTLADIAEYVKKSQITRVELRPEDVLSIVNTLVVDGLVQERVVVSTDRRPPFALGTTYYVVSKVEVAASTPYTSFPCGMCPVSEECTDDGVISPANCIYLAKWLEF
eukprot:jgi/Mesvir1/7902/Mv11833-RA.1